VVRIQKSGNKDTSWNQPEILLWGAAELASGNLCVCFPELAVLFSKRRRQRPVFQRPSNTQIKAWNESAAKGMKVGLHRYLPKSLMSTMVTSTGNESYFELQDQNHFVNVTAPNKEPRNGEPLKDNVIMLQNEFKVEHEHHEQQG
jgi:hypothetical protein